MLRSMLAGSLGLGLLAGSAAAQAPAGRTVIAATPAAPVSAALGRPIPLAPGRAEAITPTSFASDATPPQPVVRAQAPDPVAPTFPVAPGIAPPVAAPAAPLSERYNCGMVTQPPSRKPFFDPESPWLNWIPGVGHPAAGGRPLFQSDHAFDGFISPVSNPFLFEDPRALTELRPIFIYQSIPNKNWATHGGDIEFFGLQGRLAISDCFSLVMNKLGFISQQPHTELFGFQDATGFAELSLGPKWTFLRNDQSGTLGALGLNFEIPTGPRKVFQDTGNLSLDPYLSMGQNFLRSSYGSFNALGTLGYSFSVNKQRSDHLYTSLHLDFDVANAHKFYPLIELNWFHYTKNGHTTTYGFEGRDLYNLGSDHVQGNDDFSLAVGFRYKFTECLQFGTAVEFPVTGRHDLMDFRLTFDVIFRY
jgi:hypothetical protein